MAGKSGGVTPPAAIAREDSAVEETAREFDEAIHDHELSERRRAPRHGQGGGVYRYETTSGARWRYVVRRSDGSQTSKRGFSSEKAARDARRRLIEKQERGEIRQTKETFGVFWERWLNGRRPYLEPGSWQAYERDGRLRLLPALGVPDSADWRSRTSAG